MRCPQNFWLANPLFRDSRKHIIFNFSAAAMKSKTSSGTGTDLKTKIKEAYLDYVLTEGVNPTSVYHLSKNKDFTESDFYQIYNTFDAVSKDIWETILQQVFTSLETSDEYAGFSVREKVLSFYFTLVQEFRKQRSYVSYSAKNWARPGTKNAVQISIAKMVGEHFEKLVQEGYETGELINRSLVSSYYSKAMLAQFWLVVDFWIKDTSSDFEDTDAFIEKTINLGFGMMAENTLDKAFDLAKFLWGRTRMA